MNTRTLLLASAAFNLVLLVMFAAYSRPKPAAASEPAQSAPAPQPARKATPRTEAAAGDQPTSATAFNWRQVESEDYKRYIANLRSIGCPEETIRDIIVADVTKLYAQKLAANTRAKEFKYWQGGSSRTRLAAENRRIARDLDRERWSLLRDLLGPGVEAESRKSTLSADAATEDLVLGFLSEAKRAAVREIVERYSDQEQELARKGLALTQKERADLKQLRDQRSTELAGVLTPEELLNYDLRTSTVAENLRARLAGVDFSEAQFREVYRLQKSFDDEFGQLAVLDAKAVQRRGESMRKLDDDIKSALGEPLYTEMRRAQDPAWRGLVEVARTHNVSPATMEKVFETKKLVEESVRAAMSDASVPRENRVATLKSIGEQTEQAMVQLLGEKGWEAYKQNGGYWVPGQQGGGVTFRAVTAGGDTVQTRAIQLDGVPGGIAVPASGAGLGAGSERRVIIESSPAPARP